MKHLLKNVALATALATAPALAFTADDASAADPQLQNSFDHIGAEVHKLTVDGRDIFYIDEGRDGDRPVVFISGQGTSLEAFQLTEFARSSRQALGLRAISVERNGFGASAFDPALGYDDYNREVLTVLDHLGVDKFAIMAISGGGAYAGQLAAAAPERLLSLSLGVAVAFTVQDGVQSGYCDQSLEEVKKASARYTRWPKDWWTVFRSPTLSVPGWQTRAYTDATRSFFVGGQLGSPDALAHENLLPCSDDAKVDLSEVRAPAYLYYGGDDELVGEDHLNAWKAALPNVKKATLYQGEGHATQYRHWVQVMADMAGHDDQTVVCRDDSTQLVPNDEVRDDDRLDLCAWPQDD